MNCVLNEMRARESNLGISQTRKMTYYQVKNYPVKILDVPGFQDKQTIENTINELKSLKIKLNKMKDILLIILYILD